MKLLILGLILLPKLTLAAPLNFFNAVINNKEVQQFIKDHSISKIEEVGVGLCEEECYVFSILLADNKVSKKIVRVITSKNDSTGSISVKIEK